MKHSSNTNFGTPLSRETIVNVECAKMWRPMKCPYPAACASQERQPGLERERQSTDGTDVWSILSVGGELGPPMSARTRMWAEVTVRPESS